MTTNANRAVLERAGDRWNAGDLDGYLRLYSPEVTLHGYPGVVPGLESARGFYRGFFSAFPGSRLSFDDVFGDDDRLACRFVVRATHGGEFQGIAATGRQIGAAGHHHPAIPRWCLRRALEPGGLPVVVDPARRHALSAADRSRLLSMRLVPQLLANIAGMAVVFALVLFLPAGTLAWTAGWIFFALFFVFVLALSFWLLRFNRDLLVERLTGVGRRDQKTWDKVILAMAGLGFFAWLALMALDAGRFHWSHVPMWAQALGAVLLIGSFWLFYLTFRYNPYLSPAVRLQSERAHRVVDTGPYHYVRHPMYAGFALFTVEHRAAARLVGRPGRERRRWSRWSRCALRSKNASCARSSRVTTCTRGACDIG